MYVDGIDDLQRKLNVVNEAHRESLRCDRIIKKGLRKDIKLQDERLVALRETNARLNEMIDWYQKRFEADHAEEFKIARSGA